VGDFLVFQAAEEQFDDALLLRGEVERAGQGGPFFGVEGERREAVVRPGGGRRRRWSYHEGVP
jgi:hypothetical protein